MGHWRKPLMCDRRIKRDAKFRIFGDLSFRNAAELGNTFDNAALPVTPTINFQILFHFWKLLKIASFCRIKSSKICRRRSRACRAELVA
jgi:hypothetical protein